MLLRSRWTSSAIWSSVEFGFLATFRKTWRSMGLRLYRQLRRSLQVAPLLVSSWMLSMAVYWCCQNISIVRY